MADESFLLRKFKKSINLKSTGSTILVEARPGRKFVFTRLLIIRTALVGTPSVVAFSVGNDAGGAYSNLLDGDGLTLAYSGLDVAGITIYSADYDYVERLDIGTNAIRFNVQTADTTSTTDTADVMIEGYLT